MTAAHASPGGEAAKDLPVAGLKQGNVTWLPGRISEGMVAEAVPDVAQRAVSPCFTMTCVSEPRCFGFSGVSPTAAMLTPSGLLGCVDAHHP